MKGLKAAPTAIVAATWFAASAVAQLDPVVIKVLVLSERSLSKAKLTLCPGLQILLQDQRYRVLHQGRSLSAGLHWQWIHHNHWQQRLH